MKNEVWTVLCNCRFKTYYIGHLVTKFQKYERNTNVFLAISSSGSIAAWAIWQIYPMVWGGIIALSQVITVVKPYIPFFKYVKELNLKLLKLEGLNIDLEKLYYKITKNKISEEDSTEQYFSIQKQISEILCFSDDTIFDIDENIIKKANKQMKVFLHSKYKIEIDINP